VASLKKRLFALIMIVLVVLAEDHAVSVYADFFAITAIGELACLEMIPKDCAS
jgi:hypothetical protein